MEQKITNWSRFANDFEERNNYVVGKTDVDLILTKVAALEKLGNVLELGCGNGTYSKVLAKNADYVLATDISDEMVEASKKRLKTYANVKVEKADCFHLSYPSNSFDTVFMANLIHIIPCPGNAILECRRVLKNGGLLIVTSYTQKGMKFRHKIGMVYRYLKSYGKPPKGGRNFGLMEATSLIQLSGLNVVDYELIGKKTKAFFVKATVDEKLMKIIWKNDNAS